MQNRLLLLKFLTLLLYAGPLLAGVSGHGWNVLPAFATIFVLWQIVMRPSDWPREPGRWREAGVMAGAFSRVALLVVLVTVMFGIGRGIGGVLGQPLTVPAGAALALSFLAVPLARLVWNPEKDAEMERFLDDALCQISGMKASLELPEEAEREVAPLLLLPDQAPDASARAGVSAIIAAGSTPYRMRALMDRLTAAPGQHAALRRGLILWSADRLVAERFIGCGLLADAFAAAEGDDALLGLFAEVTLPLIVAIPEAWGDFPETARVREAAVAAQDPATARGLAALAEALDEVERREDGEMVGLAKDHGVGDGNT